jgi:hypothetical protein
LKGYKPSRSALAPWKPYLDRRHRHPCHELDRLQNKELNAYSAYSACSPYSAYSTCSTYSVLVFPRSLPHAFGFFILKFLRLRFRLRLAISDLLSSFDIIRECFLPEDLSEYISDPEQSAQSVGALQDVGIELTSHDAGR